MSEHVSEGIFELLAEDRRTDILDALLAHRREPGADDGIPFNELFRRSGIEDKGNFNYHLGKMRDSLVEKDDAAYGLSPFGEIVLGAVLSGRFDEDQRVLDIDEACPICEAHIQAEFEPGRTAIACRSGHTLIGSCLPPGVRDDRAAGEVLRVAARHFQVALELSSAGICIKCFGREDGEFIENGDGKYTYRTHCHRCGHGYDTTPAGLVVRHPAVIALGHAHGYDLLDRAPWELPFTDVEVDVSPAPAFRLTVTIHIEDEGVRLTMRRDGTIVGVDGDPQDTRGADHQDPGHQRRLDASDPIRSIEVESRDQ